MCYLLSTKPTHLLIQKSCVYYFRRRDLRGKRPTPPPAIFSFLFCLAPFCHNKIRTQQYCYVHTLHTLASYTPKKREKKNPTVRANHALVFPSVSSDRANLEGDGYMVKIHLFVGVKCKMQAYYPYITGLSKDVESGVFVFFCVTFWISKTR